MDWRIQKKLKKAMRRTVSLLLAVLMLNISAFAADPDEKALRELYGDDWKAVSALQVGDSYISGETMYICHEEIYVDWTRVKSAADLDPSGWGNEERLLLMTDTNGKNMLVGNDYAKYSSEPEEEEGYVLMRASEPTAVRRVVSGITTDTSGNNAAEYVDELIFPDMDKYYNEYSRRGKYSYPDTFRTLGTLNAPYIEYAGIDSDNGNQRKFKIILAKDDGSKSNVGLSHNDDYDEIQLRGVGECGGFTFYIKDGVLKIFENIKDEDDLLLVFSNWFGNITLYGQSYETFAEMTTSNAQLYLGKKVMGKRIEVISLSMEDAEQNPEALENVYGGAIEFYRWEKITSSSQLPTGDDTYRALLVWDDKYFLQGDDFRKKSGSDSMALYINEEKKDGNVIPGNVNEVPEINLEKNEFYTIGGMGTPYLKFAYRDDNESNDKCPYYTFQLAGVDDQPSRKWLCDGDNVLSVCLDGAAAKHGGLNVGIIVGKEASSSNNADPGKVKLFFNDSGGYDTGFDWEGNIFYGDDDGMGWDYGQFTLYIGKPVVYPAVRQNYVVGEDQFMHISQNGAMLKNVTITVEKGGVLSIESWFMNNGRIVVNGGTLIVQNASNPLGDEMADDTEDSVIMPFSDIHPTVSGSLELKNGAELIVMEGTRAAFSSIKATTGSSILNCGILLAETIDLHSSTLDNRKNAAILAGYDFRGMNGFRVDDLIVDGGVAKMPKMFTRLQSDVGCITRRMYSGVHNDGWVTHATLRMAVQHDSVKQSGSGSYTKVKVGTSEYLLAK